MTEGTETLDAAPAGPAGALSSNRLGRTLRAVVLAPRTGFEAAVAQADERKRLAYAPQEGTAPFVLAAFGGGALVLFWLKLGALVDVREVSSADFHWGYVFGSMVAGAVLGIVLVLLWGLLGVHFVRALGGAVSRRDLRLTAGLSNAPLLIVIVVILPLDLAILGRASFTSERLTEIVPMMWAAFSVAVSAAVAVWSLVLLERGTETVSGLRGLRAWLATGAALLCLAMVVAVPSGVAFLTTGGTIGALVCGGIVVAGTAIFGYAASRGRR